MINSVGFEYQNQDGETAFETFLRYSNEKEKSSTMLGRILGRLLIRDGMSFLDIGSGNGEYLRLALSKIKHPKKVKFTLLEPSQDLVWRLGLTARNFPSNSTVQIKCSMFEDFIVSSQFDVILVSHVPLVGDQIEKLQSVFERILRFLKPNGCLIMVLRARDDVHEFRTVFKSRLIGKTYQSIVIDDAIEIFEEMAKTVPLYISRLTTNATLYLPYPNNMRDVVLIVEFFLNRKWKEFPADVRESVLEHIQLKNGVLRLIDGFAVVSKLDPLQIVV